MAKEMLRVWFETDPGSQGDAGVKLLAEVDEKHRR
jgi:hypothetical protein